LALVKVGTDVLHREADCDVSGVLLGYAAVAVESGMILVPVKGKTS
jgi:hypothetical protein